MPEQPPAAASETLISSDGSQACVAGWQINARGEAGNWRAEGAWDAGFTARILAGARVQGLGHRAIVVPPDSPGHSPHTLGQVNLPMLTESERRSIWIEKKTTGHPCSTYQGCAGTLGEGCRCLCRGNHKVSDGFPGACAAEGIEAKRVGKEPDWAPLLRTVAVATAGKTGTKWDFSSRVAADFVLPRRPLVVLRCSSRPCHQNFIRLPP